ncbi:hypothetical protein BGX31_003826 [Mortierella sp. GBA43]|nr:hypothetical protein BGX31_003826 [Mortierella sp. GBA43]
MWWRTSPECLLCILTALTLLQHVNGADGVQDKNQAPPATSVVFSPETGSPDTSTDTSYPIPVSSSDNTTQQQQDPCTTASRLIGPISYDVVKACLDADFAFPKTLRRDTVATIKNLISNFYVFEDLAATPPDVDGLTFQPVQLIKEIEQWQEQSRTSSLADDDDEEEEEDSGEQGDKEDAAESRDDMDQARLEAGGTNPPPPPQPQQQQPKTHREFHDGISRILSKARDGHLSYDADCFRAFRFQHGFFMNHVVRDGQTVIKVHAVTPYFQSLNDVPQDILNCDVVTIAGTDAVEYIQRWADEHVSMSKDADIRFNAALATPQYRTGTVDFFIPGKFSERFMLPEEMSLEFAFRCPSQPQDTLNVDVKWVGFYTHDRTRPYKDMQSYYEANCIKSADDVFEGGWSRFEKEQDPVQRNITNLKAVLRELLDRPVHSSTNADLAILMSATEAKGPGLKAAVASSETPSNVSKSIEDILTELDIISPERLPVVKFYDDYGGRTGGMNMAMGDPLFAELYRGQHGINALLLNDGKTGVITVRTESSAIHGIELMEAGAMGMDHLIRSYGEPIASAYKKGFFERSVSHTHRNLTFTDYLSDRCAITDRYVLHADPEKENKRERKPTWPLESKDHSDKRAAYHPWDPENITILTDGYCGSSCALISNALHTQFGVKTVVIGGRTSSTQGPMSYSTFPGLQVIDDMFILNEVHDVRTQMMSELEQGSEGGGAVGVGVQDYAGNLGANGDAKVEDDVSDDEHDSQDEDSEENVDDEEKEDEKDDEDDLELFYPKNFAHKSRLRLTWRQIYNTGEGTEVFQYSPSSDEFEPRWGNDQWHEYSFTPASHRLDYTDHNVHSMGAIWIDTRNVVWGTDTD